MPRRMPRPCIWNKLPNKHEFHSISGELRSTLASILPGDYGRRGPPPATARHTSRKGMQEGAELVMPSAGGAFAFALEGVREGSFIAPSQAFKPPVSFPADGGFFPSFSWLQQASAEAAKRPIAQGMLEQCSHTTN